MELPPRQAATAVGNLLGVWIEDHATIDTGRLEAIANETGGVEIGGDAANGQDVADMLAEPGAGGVSGLQIVLEALLSADVAWAPTDLAEAERPGTVVRVLSAAAGSNVATLQADEVASGILRASPDQVTEALVEAFGGPATEAVPVIVLNGNGVPGIGEAVAERIMPGGFRVAVSQNASNFDHRRDADRRRLARRRRSGRTCARLAWCGERVRVGGIGYRSRDGRRREGLHRLSMSERRRAG